MAGCVSALGTDRAGWQQRFRHQCLPCASMCILLCLSFCSRGAYGNSMFVVGSNVQGQLGLGDKIERATFTQVENLPLKTIRTVCAGLYHSAASGLHTDGREGIMFTWGRNDKGQLGTGTVVQRLTPGTVAWPNNAEPNIVEVACGEDSTFALTVEGDVYSWGSNDYGQLGISDGSTELLQSADGKFYRESPQLISLLLQPHIMRISAGAFHVHAISDTGMPWCWGANSEGQLGVGDISQRNLPVPLTHFSEPIIQASGGAFHTILLSESGKAFTMGTNQNGQLGHGDTLSSKTPREVTALSARNVSLISAGQFHSLALDEDGVVWAWGANDYGQLGTNNMERSLIPASVIMGKDSSSTQKLDAYAVFAGQRHTFVVSESGDIFAFGNNDFGMLGTNDRTQRNLPTFVTLLRGDNVYMLASGGYHTLAVTGCFNLALPCSNKGTCDAQGQCVCNTGFSGYRCSDECPGGIGNACNLNGQCIIEPGQSPYCVCSKGFVGGDCGTECPGGASNICSGNGICENDGTCLCDTGWSGADCSQECPGGRSNPCSNLGTCKNGACDCFFGFAGALCSIECNGGAYNPCSLNGACQNDGSCQCYPGYRLDDCSKECPGGHLNPCFGRGVCNNVGECECRLGYRSNNCSIECPGGLVGHLDGFQVVARECSGHGVCNYAGQCECLGGYTGEGCEIPPPNIIVAVASSTGVFFVVSSAIGVWYYLRKRKRAWLERERKRRQRRKLKDTKKRKGKAASQRAADRARKKPKISG